MQNVPLTTQQLINLALEHGPRMLKTDIVRGERMLSTAEELLPKLLKEAPSAYPAAVKALQEVWRNHVLDVLLFDEDVEAVAS